MTPNQLKGWGAAVLGILAGAAVLWIQTVVPYLENLKRDASIEQQSDHTALHFNEMPSREVSSEIEGIGTVTMKAYGDGDECLYISLEGRNQSLFFVKPKDRAVPMMAIPRTAGLAAPRCTIEITDPWYCEDVETHEHGDFEQEYVGRDDDWHIYIRTYADGCQEWRGRLANGRSESLGWLCCSAVHG